MALKTKFVFCGIEIPDAYIRVMDVRGGKFSGWQADVFIYPNEEYAQPFEEPGPIIETGEYVKNDDESYALDGDNKKIRETIQQPGTMRMNPPITALQMTAPYQDGVNPINLCYQGLKFQFPDAKNC